MLSCHEATRLLSEARDRRLRLPERAQLRLHTLICRGCRNFARHMDFLGQAMRRFASEQPAAPPSRPATDD